MPLVASVIRACYGFVGDTPALRRLLLTAPVARDLAWRFVAGEDLAAGITAVGRLNSAGIKGTLSALGSHVKSRDAATTSAQMAINALHGILQERLDCNVSLKLTQIGLDIDEELCRSQLQRVLQCADRLGSFVCIDMEESRYVPVTLGIFDDMARFYGNNRVGIVIQSYLKNRHGDLDSLLGRRARVRLVKGGYWEPRAVAYRARSDIDMAFRRDIDMLLNRGDYPAVATHDPHMIQHAEAVAIAAGRAAGDYEFQMLYGVRQDLQDRIVRGGHTLRCYVPYGRDSRYLLGCLRRAPREWLDRKLDQHRKHLAGQSRLFLGAANVNN